MQIDFGSSPPCCLLWGCAGLQRAIDGEIVLLPCLWWSRMPCHCSECCASRKELFFFNLLCSSMSPSRLVLGTLSAKVCRQLHCPRAFFLTGHFYALHVKLHCAVFLYADALSPPYSLKSCWLCMCFFATASSFVSCYILCCCPG